VFNEIITVSGIARNEPILAKKDHFRKVRGYGWEVLPKHNFSGVKSG
jgi:hypothetical protein